MRLFLSHKLGGLSDFAAAPVFSCNNAKKAKRDQGMKYLQTLPWVVAASVLAHSAHSKAQDAPKPLQFTDVFNFKMSKQTRLSDDGRFLATSATPYRGDAEGLVYDLTQNQLLASIPRGTKATFNKNAAWVSFTQVPTLLEKETAKSKKEKKALKNTLVLVNTESGKQLAFAEVKNYAISDDGQWLAYRTEAKDESKTDTAEDKAPAKADKSAKKDDQDAIKADKKDKAYRLVVVNLANEQSVSTDDVLHFAISPDSQVVLYNQLSKDGASNKIAELNLNTLTHTALMAEPGITLSQVRFHPEKALAALLVGNYVNEDTRRRNYSLQLFDVAKNRFDTIALNSESQVIAKQAKLAWSEKGERLYFETKPALSAKVDAKEYDEADSLKRPDVIRDYAKVTVWHHQDAEIKPREKQQWQAANKHRHYQAVYHVNGKRTVQIETPSVRDVRLHTERSALLGRDDTPYLEKIQYQGFYANYYAIDVNTGERTQFLTDYPFQPSLSPNGEHAVYFKDGQVHLHNISQDKSRAVSTKLDGIFADDRHDYPSPQPGYGVAGWYEDGSAALIYSKFDIWQLDSKTGAVKRLTQGYKNNTQYRVVSLDKKAVGFNKSTPLFVKGHNLSSKQTEIATLDLVSGAFKTVLDGDYRYDLRLKAKDADTVIFTRQSYHEYPDFWQTDSSFSQVQKVTDLNPQVTDFAWGQKPELISYKGFDGEDLQGVLIKPHGYQEGDKVPVLIYFYRYMSQRMYDFPRMELNHRPNFPMFTSNGYAVFLPDIRFEVGYPGPSSTKTMINAAQALIDQGIAHPDKIGLQGHSWAGYQSAFMVTQTDMFKAVVSGAPVTNMTSAYSGIRLKSGLARQFQYETGQSRIGKTLFEDPEIYIENSPVFFADKVNTPIMLMFGDKDGAVPWQEGIQYYLALKRAKKDVIFLQYADEPHHLKKFPNQVDFSIRMKEYFDHHLMGKPAPKWMIEGEAWEKE